MTVPAYGWLWSAEDEHAGHHRRYSLGRLDALLARCAFHVDYATYFFAPFTLPVFLCAASRIASSIARTSRSARAQRASTSCPRSHAAC